MTKLRKTSQIVVRLTDADRAKLDVLAERTGIDISSFVRMKIRQAINDAEANNNARLSS